MPSLLPVILLTLCFLVPSMAWGGEGLSADSAGVSRLPGDGVPAVDPWPGMVAGAAMTGVAAIGRASYPHGFAVADRDVRPDRGTGWLRFAPVLLPWVMKAAGQPTASGWGRMAVSQGAAAAIMFSAVEGLKHGVTQLRPDGSDYRSFPSGHAAVAFMGATMVARELGWRSPWYTVGAYTLATAIAVERVVDRHHYPADVVAGAGIGILSTELGYFIGDLIFGGRQLSIRASDLRVNSNFSYLSLECGLALPLGHICAGETAIERMPALSAAMRGGWGIDDHWGLAVELGLLSTPLIVNVHHDRTFVKSLSSVGAIVLPYYTYVMSNRVSFNAEAGVGYRRNFALKVEDDAVSSGGGTPVGRLNVGCVLRLSPRFSARASVGYEISHYKFSVRPSSAFHIPRAASVSGTSSALLLSISSRYEF